MRGDLSYAVRSLARSPGFTAAAILTLSIGIGATTAIYSVVSTILLNPLPYPDADRLFTVVENIAPGRVGFPWMQRGSQQPRVRRVAIADEDARRHRGVGRHGSAAGANQPWHGRPLGDLRLGQPDGAARRPGDDRAHAVFRRRSAAGRRGAELRHLEPSFRSRSGHPREGDRVSRRRYLAVRAAPVDRRWRDAAVVRVRRRFPDADHLRQLAVYGWRARRSATAVRRDDDRPSRARRPG